MSKTNLVVVESPGKLVTIGKYLNSNPALAKYGKFEIIATQGFFRDLSKKNMGIDIEKGWEMTYEYMADRKDVIEKIKNAAKGVSNIYLASDADASGECIADDVRVLLNLGENYKRILFTEITSQALQHAIEHPTKIDKDLLASQQCRRMLDRVVGFKLSPLLWKSFNTPSVTLSAGRVQSCLLHLIVLREREIAAFKNKNYWSINGDFSLKIAKDVTQLEEVKLYKDNLVHKVDSSKEALDFFKTIKNNWKISKSVSKVTQQKPDFPFITSTLQQEAGSLRMGVKQVMSVAQKLYEAGLITYMRTDSYNMSDTFKASAGDYILKTYGKNYYEGGDLRKKSVKGEQGAHECIRITDPKVTELPAKHTKDEKELYKLIWQRSVGFLMTSAQFDQLEIGISDAGMAKNLEFSTTFKKVKFNGFLVVYGIKNETNDFENYMKQLKAQNYVLSCQNLNAKNTFMSPPARYNDAALVKLMETVGIARPSTTSSIIEKIYDRTYVIKTDIKGIEASTIDYTFTPSTKSIKEIKGTTFVGAEVGKVKPTLIGFKIDEYLEKNFDYIIDKDFTAHMESDLDRISQAKAKRNDVLNVFWKKFSVDLNAKTKTKEAKQKIESESREIKIANKTYKIRIGPYGPLIEYEAEGKKAYISLKGYLPIVKKEYLDIDEEDIKFLLSLPKKIGTVDGKDVILVTGPYGLYIKFNDSNIKIPRFAFKDFGETKSFNQDQIKGFIEYAEKNPPAKKSDAENSKSKSVKSTNASPKSTNTSPKSKTKSK